MLSCWKTEVWNRGTTKFLQGYIWVVGRSEQKSHISRPGNGEMLRISVKFALQYKVTARQALLRLPHCRSQCCLELFGWDTCFGSGCPSKQMAALAVDHLKLLFCRTSS